MPMRLFELRPAMAAGDLAVCRELLRRGSRSFYLAACVLPPGVRDDATALYAFCRVADDAIDNGTDHARALADLQSRLDAIYAGRPLDYPVDRAMAVVVRRHAIPRALPDALLEGLAWDVSGVSYRRLADLRAYAARVAGSVGVMMALLMGRRDRDTLARACELGIAMQLTNIARDVGEDARAGRVYLPHDWLAAAGCQAATLIGAHCAQRGSARVVEHLLAAAEAHYAFAEPGVAALPPRCRPGVRAAARFYRAIGERVAANDFDSVSRRAVVSLHHKLALLGGLGPALPAAHDLLRPPSSDEIAFMLDAVAAQPVYAAAGAAPRRWWHFRAQWIWVLELFATLEYRERLDSGANPRVE